MCAFVACRHDGDDCDQADAINAIVEAGKDPYTHCAPDCEWSQLGNGCCDAACATDWCFNDGGECDGEVPLRCDLSPVRFNPATHCAPGCKHEFVGDLVCNQACLEAGDACMSDLLGKSLFLARVCVCVRVLVPMHTLTPRVAFPDCEGCGENVFGLCSNLDTMAPPSSEVCSFDPLTGVECRLEWLNDGICAEEEFTFCTGDCADPDCVDGINDVVSDALTLECAPGCLTSDINDGVCQPECEQSAACSNDGMDCTAKCTCTFQELNNRQCDQKCNTAECNVRLVGGG